MRFRRLWKRVRESMWLIPSLLTIAGGILAYTTLAIDRGNADLVRKLPFVFGVGADGARATLSAIAQSVITVTGVVFSVTIIALQLAATQFTPRVLRSYLSDRGNQWVLGIFIGTFTYTILVERTVGSAPGEEEVFVPPLSVTVAIVLVLVSVGALIFFVNHISQSIRATVIVSNVTADARRVVDRLFPGGFGEEATADEAELIGDVEPHLVLAHRAGYLEAVEAEAIFSIAKLGEAVIRMEVSIGQFVLPGEPLASVWLKGERGDGAMRKEVDGKVREAFALGEVWTLQQDLEGALVELTDIAVRALSPSLNDPTTATMCVDRVGEILTRLATRPHIGSIRRDPAGRVHFVTRTLPPERAVELAFEKIRHFGAQIPSVAIRLIEVCGRVGTCVPADWRPPLEAQVRETLEASLREVHSGHDRERIRDVADHAIRLLSSASPPPPP